MGNRAVITPSEKDDAVSIYLHWNGGLESVLAFLHAARDLGVRDPLKDESYGMARLAQVIGMFFVESTDSLGIQPYKNADKDNFDNGVYVLGEGFTIAKRSEGYNQRTELDQLDTGDRIKYQKIYDIIMQRYKVSKAIE